LVPPTPGVLCALGCAIADVQYDFGQTIHAPAETLSDADVAHFLARHTEAGYEQLVRDGVDSADIEFRHFADMAYRGQIHSLRVPIRAEWSVAEMAEAFAKLYREEYGPPLGVMAVMFENLRTTAVGVRRLPQRMAAELGEAEAPAPESMRSVYFGQWMPTSVYSRRQLLPGMVVPGPAIVEQSDATTVVEPGMRARVDGYSNLIVEVA
ncbi:MAG: hypothetical protein M0Z47_02880, partial [Actinomycetota bacterium]|nr:hypothetical protein [Actinomycetota bacterium]